MNTVLSGMRWHSSFSNADGNEGVASPRRFSDALCNRYGV